ncbi:tRNA preQ1(34) S-adenosylmethionine ribosyltransferase-isomerase QueA [Candidatus Poribacteria bacterium]
MKVSLFDYHLPEELIAQYPLPERDESRLMVLNRDTKDIQHITFAQLPEFLSPGDLMVLNNTKVIPARLIGKKGKSGGKVEVLLLSPRGEGLWEALVKRSSRIASGTKVVFGDGRLVAKILGKTETQGRLVRFEHNGDLSGLIEEFGRLPLPPYIKREVDDSDEERYQTIYAKKNGAVAAPTAGLHFTAALFARMEARDIRRVELMLHVGLGTFQPVRVENIEEHDLHSEEFEVTPEVARQINETRDSGGKIVAVGTTSVRTLESSADASGHVLPGSGSTDIFIYPGHKFHAVDALVTNFHLPKSTLLMLVSAFAGRDFVMEAYREAVTKQYRFYSYGDAMLIL